MALMKTTPTTTVGRMVDPFDRFFDRLFRREPLFAEANVEATWLPALDFSETEDSYVIRLEVPGIPKENLDVMLENNLLTVSGRRESTSEEKADEFIWREREVGRFSRTVRLPTAVVEDKIDALVQDGVLKVVVPKAEKAVKSKIMIK